MGKEGGATQCAMGGRRIKGEKKKREGEKSEPSGLLGQSSDTTVTSLPSGQQAQCL